MGEKAEVSSVLALRSGRGLCLSTLTPAVSVLRGPLPGCRSAAANQSAAVWWAESHEFPRQGNHQQSNHVGMEADALIWATN